MKTSTKYSTMNRLPILEEKSNKSTTKKRLPSSNDNTKGIRVVRGGDVSKGETALDGAIDGDNTTLKGSGDGVTTSDSDSLTKKGDCASTLRSATGGGGNYSDDTTQVGTSREHDDQQLLHEQQQLNQYDRYEHELEKQRLYRELMKTGSSNDGHGGGGMYYDGDTPSMASTSVHGRDALLRNPERQMGLRGDNTASMLVGDSFRGSGGGMASQRSMKSAGHGGTMSRDMMAMMMREEGLLRTGGGLGANSIRGERGGMVDRDFYGMSGAGRMINTRGTQRHPNSDYLLSLSPETGRVPIGSNYPYQGDGSNLGDGTKSPGNNFSTTGGGGYSPNHDGTSGLDGSGPSQMGSPSLGGGGIDGVTGGARGLSRARMMLAADTLPGGGYPLTAKEQAEVEREEDLLFSILLARRQRSRGMNVDDISDGGMTARSQLQMADDLVRLGRDGHPRGRGSAVGRSTAGNGADPQSASGTSVGAPAGNTGTNGNEDQSMKETNSSGQNATGGPNRMNRRVSPTSGSISSSLNDPMATSTRGMTNMYPNENLLGMDFSSAANAGGGPSLGSLYNSTLMGMSNNDCGLADALPSRREHAMMMMGNSGVGARGSVRNGAGFLGPSSMDPLGISQSSAYDLYGVGPGSSRYDYLSGSMNMSLSGSGSRRRVADSQLYNDPYSDMMLLSSNNRRSGVGGMSNIDRRLQSEYGNSTAGNPMLTGSKYQSIGNRIELLDRRTHLSPSSARARMMMIEDGDYPLDMPAERVKNMTGSQQQQYNRRFENMMMNQGATSMDRAASRSGVSDIVDIQQKLLNRGEMKSQLRGMKRFANEAEDASGIPFSNQITTSSLAKKSQHQQQQPKDDELQEYDKSLMQRQKQLLQEQQLSISKPKRTHKKKPADMPRRPLSAYNLFFSVEREKILSERKGTSVAEKEGEDGQKTEEGAANADASDEVTSETIPGVVSSGPKALLRPLIPNLKKRRPHRKTHGAIGFQELARMVGQRWKDLPEDQRKYYKDLAADDHARQKAAMEEYAARLHVNVAVVDANVDAEDIHVDNSGDDYERKDNEAEQPKLKKVKSELAAEGTVVSISNATLLAENSLNEGKVDASSTLAKKRHKDQQLDMNNSKGIIQGNDISKIKLSIDLDGNGSKNLVTESAAVLGKKRTCKQVDVSDVPETVEEVTRKQADV